MERYLVLLRQCADALQLAVHRDREQCAQDERESDGDNLSDKSTLRCILDPIKLIFAISM